MTNVIYTNDKCHDLNDKRNLLMTNLLLITSF